MSFKTVIPKAEIFVSSNVPEDEGPAWTAGATYNTTDNKTVVHNHRVWLSLQDNNTGHEPGTDAEWWLDDGATNQQRMFDENEAEPTRGVAVPEAEGSGELIDVVVNSSSVDHVGLFGLDAETAQFDLYAPDGTTILWTENVDLKTRIVRNLLDYFRAPWNSRDDYLTIIPSIFNSTLRVQLRGGVAQCGDIVAGRGFVLGETKQRLRPEALTFTEEETDSLTRTVVTRRGYAKTLQSTVYVEGEDVDNVHKQFLALQNRVAVWEGDHRESGEGLECCLILGRLDVFRPVIEQDTYGEFDVTIVGLKKWISQ